MRTHLKFLALLALSINLFAQTVTVAPGGENEIRALFIGSAAVLIGALWGIYRLRERK